MAGVKIYPTGDPTALPVPGEPNMAGHDTPHDTPAKGSSFASAGREEELKRDLAQRVPGLEQLAEIPGVVPASEERPPGPGESGFWKLDVKRAPTGVLDDAWVRPGQGLSGYVSIEPTQALRVVMAE